MKNYQDFFNPKNHFAVVGATQNREKYGWRVFEALKNKGLSAVPINPRCESVDGVRCFPRLAAAPTDLDVVILVVPPEVGIEVVKEVNELNVKRVWCQPGSESEEIREYAKLNGIEIVENSCFVSMAERR